MTNNELKLPLILIGGGGHASVLAEILLTQGRDIVAVVSPDEINSRTVFRGMKCLKKDEEVLTFSTDEIRLVNGIGMLPRSMLRYQISTYFSELGYQFESVVADSALVSPFAALEQGAQILPGAIVNTGAIVGEHTIINTGAVIEHDCKLGAYNHIAPRSVLCGQVATGDHVFVGANATIVQNMTIQRDTVVKAGTVLIDPIKT